MGEMRDAYSVLIRKPEGKRSLRDLDIEGLIVLN
jgi:hypothetical protein